MADLTLSDQNKTIYGQIIIRFREDVAQWQKSHSGHNWKARQFAYRVALDTFGVEWLEANQPKFKETLDAIESHP